MSTFWNTVLIVGLVGLVVLMLDVLLLLALFLAYRRRAKAETAMMWIASTFGNEVHVLPQKDLMVHLATDCSCSPRRYPLELPDGSAKWQVVHNALDGRPQ